MRRTSNRSAMKSDQRPRRPTDRKPRAPRGKRAPFSKPTSGNSERPKRSRPARSSYGSAKPSRGSEGRGAVAQQQSKYYTKEDIFLSRMASILKQPQERVKQLFSKRAVSTIRLNPLADKPEKIWARLLRHELQLEPVEWAPNTYLVHNRDKSELAELEEYQKGLFYIQNLSSMIPALLLEPHQNDTILDMCAAPGSKTTLIAALLGNKGAIIANDEDFARVRKLQNVLKEFHVKNTEVKSLPGEKYGKYFNNHFNKILLDAPCSGEGMIYLKGDKPLRFWNIKKVKAMARTQRKLIESAFEALKPGGTLIYSTCTLEPQENEDVVQYLLDTHPSATLETIELTKRPEFESYRDRIRPGITRWDRFEFKPELEKSLRVLPGTRTMGFYIAKIGKKG